MRSADPAPGAAKLGKQASFMCAYVGPHRLVFELKTLLSIEGTTRVDHEAILGPIDLRRWLGVDPGSETHNESLLVLGEEAVYRFVVDRIARLARSDLRRVFPTPRVLEPLTRRLHLRGIVELEEGLAFLVDPQRLAIAGLQE